MSPYSRVWTRNNPPGSQLANTADDEIRNLRQDIEERMAALCTGWTTGAATDPIVPVATVSGAQIGKLCHIHHSAFAPVADAIVISGSLSQAIVRNAQFTEHQGGLPLTFWAPLLLQPVPGGVIIQRVRFGVFRNGVNNIDCKLRRMDDATFAVSDVAVVSTASDGIQTITTVSNIGHAMAPNYYYFLEVAIPAQLARLYGAIVTYDVSDARTTV